VKIAKALGVNEDKIDPLILNEANLHPRFRMIKEGSFLYEDRSNTKAMQKGMYEIHLNGLSRRRNS
jgi:hypothetical protein